jgi:hypothetical protein
LSAGEQAAARARTPGGVLEAEEAWELLQAGRQAGKLTAEEITIALDELSFDTGQIDEFYGLLEELNIEVVQTEEPEEESLDLEGPDITTHSLQLFLKDIGKVELLTAPQEVELAKRIERGDHDAKQSMVEANLRLVVSIAKRYRNREVRLPQGVQVLDVRDLVDPPGGCPGARGQVTDDPHARPRGREAEQDRPVGAEASRRARP